MKQANAEYIEYDTFMRILELLDTERTAWRMEESSRNSELPIKFQIHIDACFKLVEHSKGIVEISFKIHSFFMGESLHEKCLVWRYHEFRFPSELRTDESIWSM